MSFESTNGTGARFTYSHQRNVDAGHTDLEGKVVDLKITGLTPATASSFSGKLPAGARVKDVIVTVNSAATLSTGGATIDIGTSGSVATNNVEIVDTAAEAAGTYFLSDSTVNLNGTFAAELAADTTLAIAVSAGTWTGGDIDVTIQYVV